MTYARFSDAISGDRRFAHKQMSALRSKQLKNDVQVVAFVKQEEFQPYAKRHWSKSRVDAYAVQLIITYAFHEPGKIAPEEVESIDDLSG